MHIDPYLYFNGRCEEALAFYATALGGTFDGMQRFEGTPMEAEVGAENSDKIMHAQFNFQGGKFFAADALAKNPTRAGNVAISLATEDIAEGTRVFSALADGGEITMPLADVFWGGKFGMVTDKFGIEWMLSAGHGE